MRKLKIKRKNEKLQKKLGFKNFKEENDKF